MDPEKDLRWTPEDLRWWQDGQNVDMQKWQACTSRIVTHIWLAKWPRRPWDIPQMDPRWPNDGPKRPSRGSKLLSPEDWCEECLGTLIWMPSQGPAVRHLMISCRFLGPFWGHVASQVFCHSCIHAQPVCYIYIYVYVCVCVCIYMYVSCVHMRIRMCVNV